MAFHNKNQRIAIGFYAVAALFILIAFVSPYWLQTDGKLANPKFINLGLWEVCLNNFQDIHRFYDTRFTGCMWVFEEEYYIIHDFLLPGFYIATQFFFTLCFTLLLASALMTIAFIGVDRDDDRYIMILLTNGATQILASVCGLISVITFGARGDGRDWMPNWEHNDMGWAFALACVGTLLLAPSGVLVMVEARRERYKRLNEIGTREASAYSISEDARKHRGGDTVI